MKSRNQYIYIIVVILLSLTALNLRAQTLDDYIKIAAENNPELKADFNRYLAALERVPQAKALPDPTVMFSIFASPVETRVGAQQAGISLTQAFPWFGQLRSQANAAEELAKARFSAFEETKNKLIYDVRSTYYDLYVLEAAVRVTEKNIKLLESFREMANIKLESATGSAVDLLRVEMELEELNNQILFLNDSRLPILTKFKELLNTETPPVIQLPDTLRTEPLTLTQSALKDSILTQNPTLAKFEYEILSLDEEISVAKKMGLPSFSLGLAYTSIAKRPDVEMPDNGKDALIFPQVGVRIPLYRSKYKSMVKEREIMQTSVTEEKTNRVNQLNTMLETTWRDYADAERRVRLYIRLTRLATQALDVIVAQYTSAGKDFEEILRMDRQLLRYELELEKARADQNTTISYLNYLTGKQY